MRIEGPGKTQKASSAQKKSGASSADGNFGDLLSSETSSASETSSTWQIASVDSLLTIQGAEDPAERASRGRMKMRSNKILDMMENLRMSILTGSMTVGQMIDVADVVASHREKVFDPQLTEIMDEIDLRAQVELAKMRFSMEKLRG